jgi:hypothetical protein
MSEKRLNEKTKAYPQDNNPDAGAKGYYVIY